MIAIMLVDSGKIMGVNRGDTIMLIHLARKMKIPWRISAGFHGELDLT